VRSEDQPPGSKGIQLQDQNHSDPDKHGYSEYLGE
jgi:hypothetical protein